MKLLLYCTKAKPYITQGNDGSVYPSCVISDGIKEWHLNGKIVAECDFEVEKLQIVYGKGWETKTIKGTENIEKLTCLSRDKLYQYCKGNGYAIHIKNLHIFDKPKELSEYLNNKYWNSHFGNDRVSKAPQNMMRVYKLKDIEWEEHILISIQPQWMCKILNGEKTIEIRKKVLREMIK